ncbi:MAG: hypothetical protein WA718_12990 [Terriglobales bacterium]
MTNLSNYRVLISGIVSPLAAFCLYALVYATLTAASADREKGLAVSPFFVDAGDDCAVSCHLGLQPAPGPDQPFEKIEAAVAVLLNNGVH